MKIHRITNSRSIVHLLLPLFLVACGNQKDVSDSAAERTVIDKPKPADIAVESDFSGRITGKVVFQGKVPESQKLMVVKDVEVCSRMDHHDNRLKVGKGNGIQDAVVSLTNVENGDPVNVMGKDFVLDQRNCAYLPHVLLAPVNTPIRILNSDGILHNIHTFGKENRPVNLAHPKHTEELQLSFKRPENVPVKCDVHGWMSAWIVVVDHPYHAVTDSEGRFTLDGIPPGTYTVTSWQESLGEQSVEVEIKKDFPVTLTFEYPVQKRDSG